MKKFLLVIMALLMCLCLFSCGEDDGVPSGMKLASNTDIVAYKLFVPESWIVANAQATTQAYVSETDRTNISVAQWEYTGKIEDWWTLEYQPQVMGTAVQDCKILNEGEAITLDKRPATKYEYTGKIGDSYFKYTVIACVTDGSIHVIHITYMQSATKDGDSVVPSVDENGKPVFKAEETNKEAITAVLDNFKFN